MTTTFQERVVSVPFEVRVILVDTSITERSVNIEVENRSLTIVERKQTTQDRTAKVE